MKKTKNLKCNSINLLIGFIGAIFFMGFLNSCNSGNKKNNDKEVASSLSKAYKDYFTIGVALSSKALNDPMSVEKTKENFNSITAENSMKWEKIHPKPGIYSFENSDKFVEFGVENNMQIIGHVLIWHSQTPEWVFQDENGNKTVRDTLISRMKDHIYTVVGRYKGKVKYWDVVNEAINDDGTFRQNMWTEIIGEDYVQKAFEFAHEADPEAMLIYNDYSLPTPEKRDAVVKLISEIKANGGQVDAIGMQAHYHLDYPVLKDLEESIIAFSELGCKVHFTEMDLNVLPNPSDDELGADVRRNFEYDAKWNPWPAELPDSMQKVIADRYVSFFKILNRNKEVIDRVTFWGVQDGSSWLNGWPIRGRSNYPLLFDREYQPKKAYWSILELVE